MGSFLCCIYGSVVANSYEGIMGYSLCCIGGWSIRSGYEGSTGVFHIGEANWFEMMHVPKYLLY